MSLPIILSIEPITFLLRHRPMLPLQGHPTVLPSRCILPRVLTPRLPGLSLLSLPLALATRLLPPVSPSQRHQSLQWTLVPCRVPSCLRCPLKRLNPPSDLQREHAMDLLRQWPRLPCSTARNVTSFLDRRWTPCPLLQKHAATHNRLLFRHPIRQ